MKMKAIKKHQRWLGCLLILLSAQGCQHVSSTGDASQAAGRVDEPASGSSSIATPADEASGARPDGMVLIKGGTFLMGTKDGMPYEAPEHETTVNSFLMDEHEVTVAEFKGFVEATGYRTDAERFGWSGVFNRKTGEWEKVSGASWRRPDGPKSRAAQDEPVCQVSWSDAAAYARWAGKRLPTEAEWEYAARGGLAGKRYAWGDDLRPQGRPVANWWQGRFPQHDTGEDGFKGRAPVKSFQPNGYGLYDVTGNVWEWCADWYADNYYERAARDNPVGPDGGTERVIRGGSWLCAENFCTNYRVAARSHATPDSGLNNLGFRCVRDV
jgi:formylglycine-generating enzyme required for sulfatase activity